MIIKSAEFVKSAELPSHYPDVELPEVAFIGRSNVGKSSLINTLTNRKNLVKTSKTPGCTRFVNFFIIDKSIIFVDLPGYGYSKAPLSIKKKWEPMIETYITTRKSLKGLFILLDIRREPKEEEKKIIGWLNSLNISYSFAITKADKLSKSKQLLQRDLVAKTLNIDKTRLVIFSAKSLQGKEDILNVIESWVNE
ncbi:MAG: YihA family ribosome biogenesis GTP-binding protein [Desulfobacterales bacterium]|nr:YihA family ribosome biogenesis GTP-binding protein [Desulfobacterales bacterium]